MKTFNFIRILALPLIALAAASLLLRR